MYNMEGKPRNLPEQGAFLPRVAHHLQPDGQIRRITANRNRDGWQTYEISLEN